MNLNSGDCVQYLDTYALVEIAKGNKNYEKVLEYPFALCELILAEFYFIMLRDTSDAEADFWLKKYLPFAEKSEFSTILEAVKFRSKNLNKNISYFDSFGYIHAIQKGGSFVTGDKAFERLPHVKYIK